MRTVFRPLVPRMEYGLRSCIERIPYSFFLLIALLMSVEGSAQVACYAKVNVSINSGIPTTLSINNLTPRQDVSDLTVTVEDRSSLEFTCSDVGKVIMASLTDTDNQICMVEIHVEDKTPLAIACRDTLISCIGNLGAINPAALIDVTSSCDQLPLGVGSISFVDEAPIEYPITSDTFQLITRTWAVKDEYGNILNCNSEIYTERFDLSLITFPDDIEIYCEQDHSDTSITGGVNFDPSVLVDRCGVSITSSISTPTKGLCLAKSKYQRLWAVNDWNTGVTLRDTQYIIVIDTTKATLDAPASLVTATDGCLIGIVIAEPILTTSCTEVTIDDIEAVVDGMTYELGDTAFVYPGTYDVVYAGRYVCANVVEPDTIEVTVVDTVAPVIDCDDLVDLAFTLDNGNSIWVKLDSIYKSLPVQACHPVKFVGRKLVDTCDTDTQDFVSSLEFCPAELRSGLTPSTIQIEVKAVSSDGISSNTCIVNIEIKEDVSPVIVVIPNVQVGLEGPDGTYTLDTTDILSMYTDNSDCLSSITMTGSGTGFAGAQTGSGTGLAHTGSGFPFFNSAGFYTFTCADTGTYHVDIIATDCDNNITQESTTLTVDANGNCTMSSPAMVGQVLFAGVDPLVDIKVDLNTSEGRTHLFTDESGRFEIQRVPNEEPIIDISHDDDWHTGLSVIDLKLMQNHILGFSKLETWQEAAGDIDQSGLLTASDLIMVKKLILGYDVRFDEQAMPWIFSVKDGMSTYDDHMFYTIPQELNGLLTITAAKRGDVSGDVMSKSSSRSSAMLPYESIVISETHTLYKLDLTSFESHSVFQISLDVVDGTIESIDGTADMFASTYNSIDIVYYDPQSSASGSFDILVKNDHLKKSTLATSDRLRAMMYDNNEVAHQLSIEPISDKIQSTILSLSVHPNPTDGQSWIDIETKSQEPSDIDVSIYDLQGRRVYSKTWQGGIPAYLFPLKLPELPHDGLYLTQVRINQTIDEAYIVKN